MGPNEGSVSVRAVLDRASTVLVVATIGAFLASFLAAGSSEHTVILLTAVALGGASLLCSWVPNLLEPEAMVGDTVHGPHGGTVQIGSRSSALLFASVYTGAGLILFVAGALGALSVL